MKKRKLLHIITRIIVGGAQINTMYSCDLADADKYEAILLTGTQGGPEGSIKNRILERNINLQFIPELVREISPIKDLVALVKMYLFIRKHKFDVVHTHSAKAGTLGRIAAFLNRTPVVVHTVHGWAFHDSMPFIKRKMYITFEKIASHFCDRIINVSDLNNDKGLEVGIAYPKKYVTVNSNIDIDFFRKHLAFRDEVRKELGIGDNEIVVGTVSRLSEQKNPEMFVEVAKEIVEKSDNIKFLFIGDGPLREKCENLITKYKLEDKIQLLGIREDAARIMSAFDISILTSRWEGLPRVFPEAMAMNLPIVATNVDGAPQAVFDNENGFLVDIDDTKKFVEKLSLLIESPDLRLKFGKRAKEIVEPKFCIKKMVKDLDELYELIHLEKFGQSLTKS